MWHVNGRLRKVTEGNLAISMPDVAEDERACLARRSLYELNLGILQLGRTLLWPPERLEALVARVVGMDILEAAVAHGTGTVIIMPHLGNWELANILLAKHYSLTGMYKHPKSTVFGRVILKARERRGTTMVPANLSGVRVLLRKLKSHEIVIVLPDQVPPRSLGEFAPFFGELTLTMTLVTKLIQSTGARAVCCYCKRLPDGTFELRIEPVDDRIYDPDRVTSLAGLNKSIERCIVDCPEQYQWQYKRYKFLPCFEKRDYGGRAGERGA
jgi:KDO2-lipid IV(A) lauroyltransferase